MFWFLKTDTHMYSLLLAVMGGGQLSELSQWVRPATDQEQTQTGSQVTV